MELLHLKVRTENQSRASGQEVLHDDVVSKILRDVRLINLVGFESVALE